MAAKALGGPPRPRCCTPGRHRGHRTGDRSARARGVRVAAVTNSHTLRASVKPHNCIISHFGRSDIWPVSHGDTTWEQAGLVPPGGSGVGGGGGGSFLSVSLASRGASFPGWWPRLQVQRQKGCLSLRVSVHSTLRSLPPSAISRVQVVAAGPPRGPG